MIWPRLTCGEVSKRKKLWLLNQPTAFMVSIPAVRESSGDRLPSAASSLYSGGLVSSLAIRILSGRSIFGAPLPPSGASPLAIMVPIIWVLLGILVMVTAAPL